MAAVQVKRLNIQKARLATLKICVVNDRSIKRQTLRKLYATNTQVRKNERKIFLINRSGHRTVEQLGGVQEARRG